MAFKLHREGLTVNAAETKTPLPRKAGEELWDVPRCCAEATLAWQSCREDGERLWLGQEKLCRGTAFLLLNVG